MVAVMGARDAMKALLGALTRTVGLAAAAALGLTLFYASCTGRVLPNQYGVEQRKLGVKTGIVDKTYGPGLYVLGPGTTLHTFPREVQVLEASYDRQESRSKASGKVVEEVDHYFDRRDRALGDATHRAIDALNVQTSDGYAVVADLTLLYSITDPVKVARDFGWGTLYVESFVINTFRNTVLSTLGKMNAESFYDAGVRINALNETEELLRQRFAERGFRVERLLLRNFRYADNYEKSLRDKKVAVQLAEKNRKESLVNEEKAKLRQIESRGNASITIAESEVGARIAKVRAEAELYSSQVHARGDREVGVAGAESKRLKAEALTQAGGHYVVALETARMFDNVDGAVMTPEQYIAFVRSAWALIGVRGGDPARAASAEAGGQK
jgi:regulator of protease activity HflC (stomatin/prohibitin superfamily)